MGIVTRFQERWIGYLGRFTFYALLIAFGFFLRAIVELTR